MARKKTSGVHTVKTTNTAAQKIEAAKSCRRGKKLQK